jgi:hypothetical protein
MRASQTISSLRCIWSRAGPVPHALQWHRPVGGANRILLCGRPTDGTRQLHPEYVMHCAIKHILLVPGLKYFLYTKEFYVMLLFPSHYNLSTVCLSVCLFVCPATPRRPEWHGIPSLLRGMGAYGVHHKQRCYIRRNICHMYAVSHSKTAKGG